MSHKPPVSAPEKNKSKKFPGNLAPIAKLYTGGEEIFNAVSHGVGALLSVAALVLMIIFSCLPFSGVKLAASIVYGLTLILLFTASTLYHALIPPKAKAVFRVLDHATIFLLIAGTYTPVTLVTFGDALGFTLFGVVWLAAIVGVVLNALSIERFKIFSMICYIAMGWVILFAIKPLVAALPLGALLLLVAGGLAYTLGLIFYRLKHVRYMHSIWHLFVLAGAILQFFCIFFYVILS